LGAEAGRRQAAPRQRGGARGGGPGRGTTTDPR